MAKQHRKQQIVKNHQGQGQLVEEIFDDNLLPDATEIEKLYRLDNDILNWLKQCAEKEQEFRHRSFSRRLDIADRREKGIILVNNMGLIFSFLIVMGGMLFSAYLIYLGHNIIGTVFAGGIIVSIVGAFLKKVASKSSEE